MNFERSLDGSAQAQKLQRSASERPAAQSRVRQLRERKERGLQNVAKAVPVLDRVVRDQARSRMRLAFRRLAAHAEALRRERREAQKRLLSAIAAGRTRLALFGALRHWKEYVKVKKQDDSDVNFVVRMYKKYQSIDEMLQTKLKLTGLDSLKGHCRRLRTRE